MPENQSEIKKKLVGNTEVRIGIGLVICLLISYYIPQVQRLAACTGVLMCTQEMTEHTKQAGLTRLKGVLCGGGIAVIVVLADHWLQMELVFFLLCGIGIVLNLMVCELVHMPKVTGRVSAITFCLVAFLAGGNARIVYAVNRFAGTLVGALVALLLAAAWHTAAGKKSKGRNGRAGE